MSRGATLGSPPTETPDFELFPILDSTWPGDGLGSVATIVAQLPDPATLREGALVIVRQAGPRPKGIRGWLAAAKSMWSKPRQAHPAVRCTALLARGYREISAAAHSRSGEELVWGFRR